MDYLESKMIQILSIYLQSKYRSQWFKQLRQLLFQMYMADLIVSN